MSRGVAVAVTRVTAVGARRTQLATGATAAPTAGAASAERSGDDSGSCDDMPNLVDDGTSDEEEGEVAVEAAHRRSSAAWETRGR